MALNFQLARIIFKAGLARSDDSYTIQPPEMAVLNDCVFDDAETIAARTGYEIVDISENYHDENHQEVGLVGSALRLSKSGPSVLLETSGPANFDTGAETLGGGLFVVKEGGGSSRVLQRTLDDTLLNSDPWDAAQFKRASTVSYPVASMNPNRANLPRALDYSFDMDYLPQTGVEVVAWEEYDNVLQRINVKAQLIRRADNVVLLTRVFEAGRSPRVVVDKEGGNAWVFYNAGPICCSLFATGTATDFGNWSYVVPYITGASDITFDATLLKGSGVPIIVYKSAANTIRISKMANNSYGATEGFGQSFTTAVETDTLNILYAQNGDLAGAYAYYQSKQGTLNMCVLYDDASFVNETLIDDVSAAGTFVIGRAALLSTDDGALTSSAKPLILFYDKSRAASPTAYTYPPQPNNNAITIKAIDRTSLAASGRNYGSRLPTFLYGRPTLIDDDIFLPTCYMGVADLLGGTRGSVFVHRISKDYLESTSIVPPGIPVVARTANQEAGSLGRIWDQPYRMPWSYANGALFNFGYHKYSNSGTESVPATSTPTAHHLWRDEIDVSDVNLSSVEWNGITVMSGALPVITDNTTYWESGFNNVPDFASVPVAAHSGSGELEFPGSYQVCATFAYRDSRGNFHESAPSVPVSFDTSAAAQDYTYTYAIPITGRDGMVIRTWRTGNLLNSETEFYLDDESPVDLAHGAMPDIVGKGNSSGASIPTTGGILQNDPLPAHRQNCIYNERIVMFGAGDGYTAWYTQKRDDDFAPEFSSFFHFNVPRAWGRIVAACELDEKLVLFCENKIGFTYGDGFDRTGGGSNFVDPVEAVSEYGVPWDQPNSILRCDEGVYFRSQYGIRLLTRQMTIAKREGGEDWGTEMDRPLVSTVVIRAVSGQSLKKQQVRFYLDTGNVLVYDKKFNQWSQFTNHNCVDAVALSGNFYHAETYDLGGGGGDQPWLYSSNNSTIDDERAFETTKVTMSIVTPWLSFAGLQGFQRVTHALFLGHSVDGASASNFDITVTVEKDYIETLTQTDFPTVPGSLPRQQFGIQLKEQKCEAVRLGIYIQKGDDAVATQRFRLTNLTLRVGLKKGRFHGSSTARI